MSVLRVLVVDDEPHARRGLANLVNAIPGFEVTAQAATGHDAVMILERGGVDVALLDVQMPGMSGLDVAMALPPQRIPALIFVTAFDRYAVKAFELAASDYILKPFTEKRLAQALDRARTTLSRAGHETKARDLAAALSGRTPARFVVISRGTRTLVSSDEVEWISGAGYYSRIHVGQKARLVRESLNSIEGRLPSEQFVRIHRSAIVRRDAIREITKTLTGSRVLVLKSGARVKVSRTYRADAIRLFSASSD